ncbi:MAG: hypothetical protein ACRCTJ_02430 [Brevinema sp.]
MQKTLLLLTITLISCTRYIKPNLYELDINDPQYEKKARYNEIEIQRAEEQNKRQKTMMDLWF